MQIKYIKGIDLSPNEVEEARRRFDEMKIKRRRMNRGERHCNVESNFQHSKIWSTSADCLSAHPAFHQAMFCAQQQPVSLLLELLCGNFGQCMSLPHAIALVKGRVEFAEACAAPATEV